MLCAAGLMPRRLCAYTPPTWKKRKVFATNEPMLAPRAPSLESCKCSTSRSFAKTARRRLELPAAELDGSPRAVLMSTRARVLMSFHALELERSSAREHSASRRNRTADHSINCQRLAAARLGLLVRTRGSRMRSASSAAASCSRATRAICGECRVTLTAHTIGLLDQLAAVAP